MLLPQLTARPETRAAVAVQTGLVLGAVFTVVAGLAATAGEAEARTDLWLRSLPTSPRRAAAVKFAAAGAVSLMLSLLMSVPAAFFLIDSDRLGLFAAADLRPAPVAVTAFSLWTLAFASSVLGGTLGRGFLAGGLLTALIGGAVPVAGAAAEIVSPLGSRFPVLAATCGLLSAMAVAAAVRLFGTRPALRTLLPKTASPRGSLRRLLHGGRSRAGRELRSLAWRELPAATAFAAGGGLALAGLTVVAVPPTRLLAAAAVCLLAGVASAATDAERSTRPFLRDRGRSGSRAWAVKTAVWWAAASVALGLFLAADLATRPAWLQPGRSVDHRDVAASAAYFVGMSLPESVPANPHDKKIVPLPTRPHVASSGVFVAASLFLVGQLCAAWCRSRLAGLMLAAFAGAVVLIAACGLPALRTPWPPLLLGLASPVWLSVRAFEEAWAGRRPYVRRAVAAAASVAVVLVCVRSARLTMVPTLEETTGRSSIENRWFDPTLTPRVFAGPAAVPPEPPDEGRLLDAVAAATMSVTPPEPQFIAAANVARSQANTQTPPLVFRDGATPAGVAVTVLYRVRQLWGNDDGEACLLWAEGRNFCEDAAVQARDLDAARSAVVADAMFLEELEARLDAGPIDPGDLTPVDSALDWYAVSSAEDRAEFLADSIARLALPASIGTPRDPRPVVAFLDWVLATPEAAGRAERLAVDVITRGSWSRVGLTRRRAAVALAVSGSRQEELTELLRASSSGSIFWLVWPRRVARDVDPRELFDQANRLRRRVRTRIAQGLTDDPPPPAPSAE